MARDGIVLSMRNLNKVTFNDARTEVVIQGGCLTSEVQAAAYENEALVVTGICNDVGALGAALGGGFGHLTGLYGLAVDNMLSLDIVLADGSTKTVTKETDPDLWWALRGAGPNFGIVTSATYKAYPTPNEKTLAFTGALMYTEDKLESVLEALDGLTMKPNMNIIVFFRTSGPPDFQLMVAVVPFYFGSEEDAKKTFSCFYDLKPFHEITGMFPYNHWSDGADPFCTKGGRKPFFGASSNKLNIKTWRTIFNQYADFVKNNEGTGFSMILLECYTMDKALSLGQSDSSAFPWRDRRFSTVIIPWYENAAIDDAAAKWGRSARDLIRSQENIPPAT